MRQVSALCIRCAHFKIYKINLIYNKDNVSTKCPDQNIFMKTYAVHKEWYCIQGYLNYARLDVFSLRSHI